MGNIRPTYIKSLAEELLREYPNEFAADFETNKLKIAQLTNIEGKALRNRVAGYVTRRLKIASKKKK
jgi:small subunit ribosomal protein S17e